MLAYAVHGKADDDVRLLVLAAQENATGRSGGAALSRRALAHLVASLRYEMAACRYKVKLSNAATCSGHGAAQGDGSCQCTAGWVGDGCERGVRVCACMCGRGRVRTCSGVHARA